MRNSRQISVANDNKPNRLRSSFDKLKGQPIARQNEEIRRENTALLDLPAGQILWQAEKMHSEIKKSKKESSDGTDGTSRFSSIKRLWAILISASFMISFAGLIYGLGFSNSMSVITLAGFASTMTLSGFIGVCFISLPIFLKEWAALSIWLVLPVLCFAIFSIAPEKIALPSAILGIVIGALSKTKTPFIAAGICLLTLGCSALKFEGFMPQQPFIELSKYQNLGLVLTVLVFLGLATQLKSRVLLAFSLSSTLLWGAIWLFSSGLSLQAVAAAIFIGGAAQYKLGKAGLDNKAFAAMTFIVLGWCLGSFGYLWLQSSFLFSEMNTVMTLGDRPTTSMGWAALIGISISAILVGGMSRHAHSRQSALSIFLTTLALGSIPFMIYRPDLLVNFVSSVPGLKIIPAIGFVLAAGGVIVFASMIVNGVRLNRMLYITLGILALGTQTVLLLDPALWSIDSAVVFGASLFVVGGLLTLFVQSKS